MCVASIFIAILCLPYEKFMHIFTRLKINSSILRDIVILPEHPVYKILHTQFPPNLRVSDTCLHRIIKFYFSPRACISQKRALEINLARINWSVRRADDRVAVFMPDCSSPTDMHVF